MTHQELILLVKREIPDDWAAESYGGKFILIRYPNQGFITLDFKNRVYDFGICSPHHTGLTASSGYKVARWRERMVMNAVEALRLAHE